MKKLEKALRDVYEKELLDDVHYAKRQPDHSFSQVHNHNMKMALKDKPNPVISFITNHSAKVACVAVMGFAAFMIGTAVMQNGTVQSGTDEDKNTSVSQVTKENEKDKPVNKENSSDKVHTEIETYYAPIRIPDSYKIKRAASAAQKFFYWCEYKSDTQTIFFTQYLKQNFSPALLGNNVISEISDRGITYTVANISDVRVRSFVWEVDGYVLKLDIPMSYSIEEALVMCRSVEATDNVKFAEVIGVNSKDIETRVYDDRHTQIYYEEYLMQTIPEIEEFYCLTAVPDGYELIMHSPESEKIDTFYTYKKSVNEQIYFSQYLKQNYQFLTSEEIVEFTCLEDYEPNREKYNANLYAFLYKLHDTERTYTIFEAKKYNQRIYIWYDDYYVFHLQVPYNFTMEEGLEVCRSVKAVSPEDMVYTQ